MLKERRKLNEEKSVGENILLWYNLNNYKRIELFNQSWPSTRKCFILGNSMKMKCLIRILLSLTCYLRLIQSNKLNEPEKVV